jgi:hypothetical protein
MGACCIYKRPFCHEGPWTCPTCGETSTPDPDAIMRGAAVVRAMFAPSDAEVCEVMLDTLAANLATVAALCASFSLGHAQHEHEQLYSNHGYRTEQGWRPGCGKAAL